MFNNFCLSDKEIMKIIKDYSSLIKKYSVIRDKYDEDLRQEIEIYIYTKLTKNRKK